MYQIKEYLDERDRSPFADWLRSLPVTTRARISARIARFRSGNLGDSKSVGSGVQAGLIHIS